MSQTQELLLQRYRTPCLTLEAVREEYLPHIKSLKYLRGLIRSGAIPLRIVHERGNPKAMPLVYLADLATWLDSQNPSNTTQKSAADHAA